MNAYTLKDKRTGLYYAGAESRYNGNDYSYDYRERPRVFTHSGLTNSLGNTIFNTHPFMAQWLKDNPKPEESPRWVKQDGGKYIENPNYDPSLSNWYSEQRRVWRDYVKSQGGILNCLPDYLELKEIEL